MRRVDAKEKVKLSNQSLVYDVFGDNEKLTITEVFLRVNQRPEIEFNLSDRTIRRAIAELVQSGMLREFGKNNNAMTFGKLSATYQNIDDNEGIIPYGGKLKTLEEFLQIMTDPEGRPFKRKADILSETAQHTLRRMMVYAILTSVDAGYNDKLKEMNRNLNNVLSELEYAAGLLQSFVDSPVWYNQYRDAIAYGLRSLEAKNPDLVKLATDYVKSEA